MKAQRQAFAHNFNHLKEINIIDLVVVIFDKILQKSINSIIVIQTHHTTLKIPSNVY